MATSKPTPAQRAALVALLHDDHTRIVVMPVSDRMFITNMRGFGDKVSNATVRTLTQRGWIVFQGYAREYRLTAEGRALAKQLEAQAAQEGTANNGD